MSEYIILEHCSPTLAGLKTGNLVSVPYKTREEVVSDLKKWNRALAPKGIRVLCLKYLKGRVLLYIYRPEKLAQDLSAEDAAKILEECGYSGTGEAARVSTLIRRLRTGDGFPHEIGLFLGYPAEDVRGFMTHHGADYKYSGLWKVYGNVEACRHAFEQYRLCTRSYVRAGKKGKTLAELAVVKRPGRRT